MKRLLKVKHWSTTSVVSIILVVHVDAKAYCTFEYDWFGVKEGVIWLILPVVIRSSQRLSHARLSINYFIVKLRMAHYISYSLLDGYYYMDTRSNSRANTCDELPTSEGTYLLALTNRFGVFGES